MNRQNYYNQTVMSYQINPPSLSNIRGKFIIDKLKTLPNNTNWINIFATGRTGSGKTTLGNLLFGIHYFMPSTGEQDCTDEINLVEFPGGLRYYDTPGVASKGYLENYNRAAFGIELKNKFQSVQNLIIAKYTESSQGNTVEKENLTASEFRRKYSNPDLIFYLIAADKQFLEVDCNYLGDLLTHHNQVIYILNVFTDKETGNRYATDENIIDITTRIAEVHHFVLGEQNNPKIIPVNCWTGEGIADLISHSYQILDHQKGRLFQELIQYQQAKTPDEYTRQVKSELLKLFAHAACQKPEGNYTCNQTIHEDCYNLFNFLSGLRLNSSHTSDFVAIKRLINQALNSSQYQNQYRRSESRSPRGASFFGRNTQIASKILAKFIEILIIIKGIMRFLANFARSLSSKSGCSLLSIFQKWMLPSPKDSIRQSIREKVKFIDTAINDLLAKSARQYRESHNSLVEFVKEEQTTKIAEIISIQLEIESIKESAKPLGEQFLSLNEEIESCKERLSPSIDQFNRNSENLSSRIKNYNFRKQAYSRRVQEYRKAIDKYEASWFPPSELKRYLETEGPTIENESSYLNRESDSLDTAISQQQRESKSLDSEINIIKDKEKRLFSLINSIQEIKNRQKIETRLLLEKCKYLDDYIGYSQELIRAFDEEFRFIKNEMQNRIKTIRINLASIQSNLFITEINEILSRGDIASVQEEINSCIEKMISFQEEINQFQEKIKYCLAKIGINKLVSEVSILCTQHHFDNTDEMEYRGKTYQSFGKHGLTILLTLTRLITSGGITENNEESLEDSISSKVNSLGDFPSEPTENEILRLLQLKMNVLFDSTFDEAVKRATF